jgi:hypothetical protein
MTIIDMHIIQNSKPSVAACIFYNQLPNNIKQIGNKSQFLKELMDLLIRGRLFQSRIP